MKKMIVPLLLGMFILSCSNLKYLNAFDGLKGRPHTIKSMSLEVIQEGKESVIDTSNYYDIIYFDKKGRKTKMETFNLAGNRSSSWDFIYDNKGNLINRILYTNDSINIKITNSYNRKGLLLTSEHVTKRKKTITKNIYDEKGNHVEENMIDQDGNITNKTLFKHNDKGKLIELISYDENNNLEGKIIMEYDIGGNIIKQEWYDSNEKLYEIYTNYKYDKHNNPIYSEKHSFRKKDTIIKRTQVSYVYDNKANQTRMTISNNENQKFIISNEIHYW